MPEGGVVKTGVEASADLAAERTHGDDGRPSSETFDEHERDTARRAYPKEIVEGIKRTTKMPKLDLAALRTESGTRPALSHEAIEQQVREKMEDGLAEVERTSDVEVDPHSRPTVAAGIPETVLPRREGEWSPASLAASTPLPIEAPRSIARPTPVSLSANAPERSPIAGWVVGVILGGLFLLVSAAGTVGFFLGREYERRR